MGRPWTVFGFVAFLLFAIAGAGHGQITVSEAAPLNTDAATDAGGDGSASVGSDGAGTWIAVWGRGMAGVGANWMVSRSQNNGGSWSEPESVLAAPPSGLGEPTIAYGNGIWIVSGLTQGLDGLGNDGDIECIRSTDGGQTWSPPVPVNSNAGNDSVLDFAVQVAMEGTSHAVAVWLEKTSTDPNNFEYRTFAARSTDGGATWSSQTALSTSNVNPDSGPDIATDGTGSWVAVWQARVQGNINTVVVARSTDGGASWTETPLTGTGRHTAARIAARADGTFVVVWRTREQLVPGMGTDDDIVFSKSADHGLSWSAPRPVNTDAVGDAQKDDYPALALDDAGNCVVAWWTELDPTTAGIVLAHSPDLGATWTDPILAFTNGYPPQLATDGAGHWITTFFTYNDFNGQIGTDGDIVYVTASTPNETGTAPLIQIGVPSVAITGAGPVDFPVTYTNAASITLAPEDVTLVTTGDVAATVAVEGSSLAERTVTLTDITGSGTVAIALAIGTATSAGQVPAPAAGPSATVVVDNTPPTLVLGPPSIAATAVARVYYFLRYTGAVAVNLTDADLHLVATGTATGSARVTNGTTASPTVEIFGVAGDGTLALVVGPGTAVDALGNATPETGPSTPFTVDTTPPQVTLGPPSVDTTATGPVSFPMTYSGATAVTLTLADVVLVATGTASGTVSLAGEGLGPYTVTVSNITGTGTLAIALRANTARDALNNRTPAAGPSPAVTVERAGRAEDVNKDGLTNAVDVQLVVNAALGLPAGGFDTDANRDGTTNALDIQRVVNAVLGLA